MQDSSPVLLLSPLLPCIVGFIERTPIEEARFGPDGFRRQCKYAGDPIMIRDRRGRTNYDSMKLAEGELG